MATMSPEPVKAAGVVGEEVTPGLLGYKAVKQEEIHVTPAAEVGSMWPPATTPYTFNFSSSFFSKTTEVHLA